MGMEEHLRVSWYHNYVRVLVVIVLPLSLSLYMFGLHVSQNIPGQDCVQNCVVFSIVYNIPLLINTLFTYSNTMHTLLKIIYVS